MVGMHLGQEWEFFFYPQCSIQTGVGHSLIYQVLSECCVPCMKGQDEERPETSWESWGEGQQGAWDGRPTAECLALHLACPLGKSESTTCCSCPEFHPCWRVDVSPAV